jgi:hypothetical protein
MPSSHNTINTTAIVYNILFSFFVYFGTIAGWRNHALANFDSLNETPISTVPLLLINYSIRRITAIRCNPTSNAREPFWNGFEAHQG